MPFSFMNFSQRTKDLFQKMNQAILILDCGATNVKACLVDTEWHIILSHSLPNQTLADPYFKGGLIWDIESIWEKLAICSRKVCSESINTEIIGVTVTTFGVDGAAVKRNGTFCYPVISWQCSRTEKVEKNLKKYFDPDWLYQITGLQSYHFNTIYKLIWLKENMPEVLNEMDYYALMPSLILYRLAGKWVTDTTMAGTSMLTENKTRSFSDEILKPLGLKSGVFPQLIEPGTIIGNIHTIAAKVLGIKAGIPVIACGHDTQFAILGSGAGLNQPVLSSGTWEILMVRANEEALQMPSRKSGVTIEWDAQAGLVNIGVQWVASGVLEWISRLFYQDINGTSLYSTMIKEAEQVAAGCNGITLTPELFPGGFSGKEGRLEGFTHETTRAHIYRSALEALSYYARYGLETLERVGNYKTKDVIIVGGGSKNSLWNQIRADVLGIPVKALDMKETTALGAAMTSFIGLGIHKNIGEALQAAGNRYEVYQPAENREKYHELYSAFVEKVFQ
jgi:L-fuculokinase